MTESISPLALPMSEDPNLCGVCRLKTAEPGYSTFLCVTCRDRLARRPFPLLIKVSALLIVVALAFAMTRFDQSIRAGISFNRGGRAERRHDYARAVQYYQEVVAIFPDSTSALIRLANAHCKVGQVDEAAVALQRLTGRKIPRELTSVYERVVREVTYELRLRQAGYNNVRTR